MKKLVGKSHPLLGGFPWVISIKTNGKRIDINEALTIREIEERFNPKDGDTIFELRPLIEFTYTRENGNWYKEKTGIGYA